MDAARALQAVLSGGLVEAVEPAAVLAPRLPAVLTRLESQRALEERLASLGVGRVGADVVEPLQRHLGGNLGMVGGQRLVGNVDDRELVLESVVVLKAKLAVDALRLVSGRVQAIRPEVDRLGRADAP